MVEKYLNTNILGFSNLFESINSTKIKKVIYASSSSVYGDSIKFPSKEKAIEYAEKNNISYNVVEPNKKEFVIKSYADNFLKD